MLKYTSICNKHSEFNFFPLTHPKQSWLHILLCCNKSKSFMGIYCTALFSTYSNHSFNCCLPAQLHRCADEIHILFLIRILGFTQSWTLWKLEWQPRFLTAPEWQKQTVAIHYSFLPLNNKHTLNVNYPPERTNVDWFWSYPSNSYSFLLESLIILSNPCVDSK